MKTVKRKTSSCSDIPISMGNTGYECTFEFKHFSVGIDDSPPINWHDALIKELETRKLYCHASNYHRLLPCIMSSDIELKTNGFIDKDTYYMTKDIERKVENNIITFY